MAKSLASHFHFSIHMLQGSFQLYVRVVDEDSGNSDDHVDDIYIDISLSVSSSFTTQTDFYGDHGNSRIRLAFRVRCNANYYGSDCATYCVNTDDSTGHYTCGPSGTKNCLSGWTGTECNTRKFIKFNIEGCST